MTINIYKELAKNKMFQETFMRPKKPGIPKEVQGWPDYLQESFCELSEHHLAAGFDLDEADRMAIEQVKKSDWYREWQETEASKPEARGSND